MMDHTTWALFEAEVHRNHEHFKRINEDRNSITIKKKMEIWDYMNLNMTEKKDEVSQVSVLNTRKQREITPW